MRLDTGLGNEFWDSTTKGKATKATINKRDYTQLKSCCAAKEIISKMQATEWEKISATYVADKGLILKICKFRQLKSKKINNPI